jgi:rubrerythrin
MATDAQLVEALLEARAAERRQAVFYRALAALAEDAGDEDVSERLNGLHADEQHHLSRLTARLLELGAALPELPGTGDRPDFGAWEATARQREEEEIASYERLLSMAPDEQTATMLREFLEAERAHVRELGGKWMNA